MDVWLSVLGLAAGLALVWLVLVVGLYALARREEEPATLRDALRLVPDVVRLLRRLIGDPEVPRAVRWRLTLLVGYLLLPIDLVPDVVPVVGYADDAVLVAWGLRSVVRRAGIGAVERHWSGTAQGLTVVKRLAGVDRGHDSTAV